MTKQSNRPQQYQKGFVEFYKLKFKVTPDVLIPRPETELLVDEVLQLLNSQPPQPPPTILDLGTGSGNIAISIAKQLPTSDVGIRIIATDISKKALKVARQNAKLHGVLNKITFLQSDLLKNLLDQSNHPIFYDKLVYHSDLIIVTNLPYIPTARIPYLDSSVKDFEPLIALDGGEDGFKLYRKLLSQLKQLCKPGLKTNLQTGFEAWKLKLLIGEIDYTHGQLAINEALKYFPNAEVEVKTDLAKKQRILKITFP